MLVFWWFQRKANKPFLFFGGEGPLKKYIPILQRGVFEEDAWIRVRISQGHARATEWQGVELRKEKSSWVADAGNEFRARSCMAPSVFTRPLKPACCGVLLEKPRGNHQFRGEGKGTFRDNPQFTSTGFGGFPCKAACFWMYPLIWNPGQGLVPRWAASGSGAGGELGLLEGCGSFLRVSKGKARFCFGLKDV